MSLILDRDLIVRRALEKSGGFGVKNNNSKQAAASDVLRRYGELSQIKDEDFPEFNANRVFDDAYILGEGPYNALKQGERRVYNNIARFVNHVLINADISQVIALGPVYDPSKKRYSFSPYFTEADTTHPGYKISCEKLADLADGIEQYSITVTGEGDDAHSVKEKTVTVTNFSSWVDMKTLDLSDTQLLAHILNLYETAKTEKTFIHCSAGLGRSGTLALAFDLVSKAKEIDALATDEEKSDYIIERWDELNKARPGCIQTQDQFLNAIDMASALIELQKSLQSQSKSTQEYIDGLGSYSSTNELDRSGMPSMSLPAQAFQNPPSFFGSPPTGRKAEPSHPGASATATAAGEAEIKAAALQRIVDAAVAKALREQGISPTS